MQNNAEHFEILKQAIIQKDLMYINQYICLSTDGVVDVGKDINNLNLNERTQFFNVLKESINTQGNSVDKMKVAKSLLISSKKFINDRNFCKAVDHFCAELGRNTTDYEKILHLKGKIEYLKHKRNGLNNE